MATKKKRAKKSKPKGAKKSAAKKTHARGPGVSASIVAERATTDVRGDVLSVVAHVSGKDESEVAGNPLSKLAFPCNSTFTDRIAFQLNAKWCDLNPRFGPADVSCSDTVDSLTREVETRLG
ncbi:MAG: hypothetical protein M3Y05_01095 [Gemmatimonadota bacterium]|nr:hypothetical protein [Gemmatimonadota bacterium]